MSDKQFTPSMTIQEIKATLVAIIDWDSGEQVIDYGFLDTLAHEIQQLVDPERDWISPFFDKSEEERVLESVAHSVVTSHMTTDMALDLLSWAALMTRNGYSIYDIKEYFGVGAAHGGMLP